MTQTSDDGTPDETVPTDKNNVDDLLELFNAEEVVEHPGAPPQQVDDPASNADAPPPPG